MWPTPTNSGFSALCNKTENWTLFWGFLKNSVSSYLKYNHSIKEQKRKPGGESKLTG